MAVAELTHKTIPTQDWPPEQGAWTYSDWLKLPKDGYTYEIIDGVLHMSPPPLIDHQRASRDLSQALVYHVRKYNLGEVLFAPVGVHLPGQAVPVEPDILFVQRARLGIIGKKYVEGAPDLVVEILSPSNWLYDRREKMAVYRAAGVQEYWIVDPRAETVEVYSLEGDAYLLLGNYGADAVAVSEVVAGFAIGVADIFA